MDSFQMYDKNKKGTIILSHYRSGGTQLQLSLKEVLRVNNISYDNLGELDFDTLSGVSFTEQTSNMLKHKNYAVILLNNSLVISHFYNSGYFDKLSKEYNLVVLERKDKEKALLSLPIWEELIKQKLFSKEWKTPLEQTEDMINFHKKLLKNKINYKNLHLGWETQMFKSQDGQNEYYYLNYLMKAYQDEINMLHLLSIKYNLHTISYEEYEYSPISLKKYYNDMENIDKVLNHTNQKIPYIHTNFIDYYDEFVQVVIKDWNLSD